MLVEEIRYVDVMLHLSRNVIISIDAYNLFLPALHTTLYIYLDQRMYNVVFAF